MKTSFFDQENLLAQLERLDDPLPRFESTTLIVVPFMEKDEFIDRVQQWIG